MSKEHDHKLLPYTVEYGPLEETVPGFLKNRGDWEKLKEITGNGTWKDGSAIKVGVGDTGISKRHIERGDLKGAIAKDFTGSRSGTDDRQGHGSHTSCHIGARANDDGIEGLASDCQIVHAKVLGDQGSGSSQGIYNGVKWMAEQGVKVINLSLGGGGYSRTSDALYKELDEQGILVFASMGNSGQGGERGGYPGRYPSTFGVTAVNYDKKLAGFSSQSKGADLTGFGVDVLSCVSSGYARYSGTSMSCPDQAGVAALMVGFFDRKGIKVKNKAHYIELMEAAGAFEDLGREGWDEFYGRGFIDVWKVIAHYGEVTDPVDPGPGECGSLIGELDFGKFIGKFQLRRLAGGNVSADAEIVEIIELVLDLVKLIASEEFNFAELLSLLAKIFEIIRGREVSADEFDTVEFVDIIRDTLNSEEIMAMARRVIAFAEKVGK